MRFYDFFFLQRGTKFSVLSLLFVIIQFSIVILVLFILFFCLGFHFSNKISLFIVLMFWWIWCWPWFWYRFFLWCTVIYSIYIFSIFWTIWYVTGTGTYVTFHLKIRKKHKVSPSQLWNWVSKTFCYQGIKKLKKFVKTSALLVCNVIFDADTMSIGDFSATIDR